MIITIDGPAGGGKSTVARALARRLGFRYLDTGAMYRAVAMAGLRAGVDWSKPDLLAQIARRIEIQLVDERVLLNGEDVTEAIRTLQVTAVTRHAADNLEVRRLLVELQQRAALNQDVVTEGRDQGSVAFPEAECKVFLTATAEERAKRRLGDLEAQGEPRSLCEVLGDINRRDSEDESRPVGRLVKPPGALEINTDGMSVEVVVDCLASLVHNRTRADQ